MKKQNLHKLAAIVLLIFLIAIPLAVPNQHWHFIMASICINATITMGLYLIARLGIVSFAQAAFTGLGSYSIAIMMLHTNLPFGIAWIAGGICAALIGALIGLLVLKMKGAYFFLITLALNQFIVWIFHSWKGVTGGYDGIRNIPVPAFLDSAEKVYYVALGLMIAVFLYIRTLERSRFGLTLRAVNENNTMVQSYGISTFSIKMLSWIGCCFITGLAGGLTVVLIRSTFPTMFDMMISLRYVTFMVFGGMSSPTGGIIGTVILMLVSEGIRAVKDLEPLIYGLVLLIALIFVPNGLLGLFKRRERN